MLDSFTCEAIIDQLLNERITLTIDFQVGFGGEIVALSDDAGVPAAVVDLGILDDDGEGVLVDDSKSILGSLVALL